MPTDEERRRPVQGDAAREQTSVATVPDGTDVVPVHRPWAGRADRHVVERRFRIDQAGWRRRIDCARRTSQDGRDELVAPYRGGRWTA